MNKKMIACITGRILVLESLLMLLPMIVSMLYHEACALDFAASAIITAMVGLVLSCIKPDNKTFYAREGFAIVALSWIGMSLLGALPFWFSGEIPHYVDALFETISGFTTTGASALPAVEVLSKGILFWRSFTHWIGGMGVLVLIMTVISPGENSMHIARAEMPGPVVEKIMPKMRDTAKLLYAIYLAMTVVEIVLLLAGGMGLFDSLVHAFGTAGTGGFSSRNLSVAAYDSPYIQWVITIFMALFGVNFSLYYLLLRGNWRRVLASSELRWYLAIMGGSTLLITINVMPIYQGIEAALRHAAFQVSSVMTTTGFATTDFNLWPEPSKAILLGLMICGACAGSTGGGVKVSRIIILCRAIRREIDHMLHPRSVKVVKFEGKVVEEGRVHGVTVFFVFYIFIGAISFLLLSFDGFDLETNFTAMLACLNNIGPGLNIVGPMGNYSQFSYFAKLVLSVDMLLGRLEIFPIVLMLVPSSWRSRRLPIKHAPGRF